MKTVMLMLVTAVLLIGAQAFTEEESQNKLKEGERQREVIRDQPRVRARAEQGRAEREGQNEGEGEQVRRREAVREREQEREGSEPQRDPETRLERRRVVQDRVIRPQISPPMLDEPRPIGPMLDRPFAGRMFGRCLDELTKAYQEKDWERIGQIIRRMHQARQQWQQCRDGAGMAPGRGIRGPGRGRGFRGPGWGRLQPNAERPRLDEFRPPVERRPRDLQPEGPDRPVTPVPPRALRRMGPLGPPDIEQAPRPVVPREEDLP